MVHHGEEHRAQRVNCPSSSAGPITEPGGCLTKDANRCGFHVNRPEFESCPVGSRSGMGRRAHPASTLGAESLSEFAYANSLPVQGTGAAQPESIGWPLDGPGYESCRAYQLRAQAPSPMVPTDGICALSLRRTRTEFHSLPDRWDSQATPQESPSGVPGTRMEHLSHEVGGPSPSARRCQRAYEPRNARGARGLQRRRASCR